jgi:beta-lactam-binding protein with PASTA domain
MRSATGCALVVMCLAGAVTGPTGASPTQQQRVPNIVGLSWLDATARLRAARLCFRWGKWTVGNSDSRLGRVLEQGPIAGRRVSRLTPVRIDIAQQVHNGFSPPRYPVKQLPGCGPPGTPHFRPGIQRP